MLKVRDVRRVAARLALAALCFPFVLLMSPRAALAMAGDLLERDP